MIFIGIQLDLPLPATHKKKSEDKREENYYILESPFIHSPISRKRRKEMPVFQNAECAILRDQFPRDSSHISKTPRLEKVDTGFHLMSKSCRIGTRPAPYSSWYMLSNS